MLLSEGENSVIFFFLFFFFALFRVVIEIQIRGGEIPMGPSDFFLVCVGRRGSPRVVVRLVRAASLGPGLGPRVSVGAGEVGPGVQAGGATPRVIFGRCSGVTHFAQRRHRFTLYSGGGPVGPHMICLNSEFIQVWKRNESYFTSCRLAS